MANPISYNDFVTAVQNAYSGGSSLTWSEVSQSLARGGCTTDNYLQYLESFPNAVDIVKNADGSIRAARINPYSSIYSSSTWQQAAEAGSYNSNLVPSTGSSQALVSVPGNAVTQSGSTSLSFTQGLNQAGNFVLKEVAPAVMAAGLGIKLGKAIDGAIYDIGTAMGLDPPWALNPETWDSITSGSTDPASRLFNTVFGIDSNGNTQMYADPLTIGLLAQWMAQQNFFNESGTYFPDTPSGGSSVVITSLADPITILKALEATATGPVQYNNNTWQEIVNFCTSLGTGYYTVSLALTGAYNGSSPLTISYLNRQVGDTIVQGRSSNGPVLSTKGTRKSAAGSTLYINSTSTSTEQVILGEGMLGTGKYSNVNTTEVPPVAGVSDQTGAQLPDTTGWANPQATFDSLRQQYPDWFANPVTNDVVQPDGSTTTYYYYPIGFPEPDGSTGTQTQNDTQVNPDDSTKTLIDYIIKILTQQNPQTDPETQTDPQTQSDTDSPTTTTNPTDTGDGDTPIVPPVTGSASSLWKIYNPSQSELDAFGAWLWSSDFIDQLKKLFNDPMQAIIGVHKVFCTPAIGGQATIKCGYLDSEVPSNWVSDQYTHIDCGTVSLPEYFGNVFDYDPFTRVSIFIPCVGIVPLDVADVMRSSINVKLHCDVLTGAMLAEVYVYRDGAGGNLYTYSGSCIVTYPVSSGTYIGAVANVVATAASVAAGIMGTVATGGALAPAAVGAAGAAVSGLAHTHTNVQHSGSFSGAAGVMGGKIPYLIITRPQTRMADKYPEYDGVGANYTSRLGACSGYVKVKEVHLKVSNAFQSELTEIEELLHSGILI